MATDKDKCDLLIVIGSSLKVRPVAHIPSSIPASVPQILINREQLHHLKFDVELLGDSDVIINQICHRLSGSAADADWQQLCSDQDVLRESRELQPLTDYYHLHHHRHHHRHCSSESERNSQLDTDTQSIKSNGSTDYLLGSSAGTCSDSGFESSTFTAVQHSSSCSNNAVERAAIERIKSDILVELNETALTCSAPPATQVGRHLSIDSSKDSGIEHCEFSSNLVDTNVVQETKTAAPSLTPTPPQRKRQTIAERLVPGTFYSHSKNSSYVFPGAQVFWNSDFSDEDDDDEDDDDDDVGGDDDVDNVGGVGMFGNVVASDEETCDLNAPLSPFLPPSLEAHIVTEISNSVGSTSNLLDVPETLGSPGQKRRSSVEAHLQAPMQCQSEETPPIKKLRPSAASASATPPPAPQTTATAAGTNQTVELTTV